MSDLTDKIRAKFPDDYKDMSDSDLESAVLSKHPEYKDLSSDTKIESKPIETKVDEHPNKLSELWDKTVNNPTVKKLLTGSEPHQFSKEEVDLINSKNQGNDIFGNPYKQIKEGDKQDIQGPGLMTIPGLDKLGETIKNKGINTGNYWSGFGGSIAHDLIDIVSSGFDPRAAGIHKSPNDLFTIEHDTPSGKTPEIAQRAMSNQPSMPRSNNIDLNPNEAALAENTIGKQVAAHRSADLGNTRGSISDIPDNDVARQLELERTGNSQPLSVDEVNKLFTNTKPLAEGTTVNFNNAKQLANNKKLGVQPNEPIIINNPKELNTDQIRKVYMKENPSDTSSPNILMQAPDVNKVKEANSYGYKSAGYTSDGSLKLERKGTYPKTINPVTKESLAQSIYDLPRGLMSVDPPFITSAAFRQAGPLIGTKQWFKSWIPAAKAFGSEVASSNIEDSLRNHPLIKDVLDKNGNVQSGYAKRIGVSLTSLDEGLNNREEAIRSDLAEKIPLYGKYVRASNRAYKTFLNTLRVGTLEDIVNGATADQSIGSKLNPFSLQSFGNSDPLNNAVLGKQIGDFINNATGRGSLGPLEDHVRLLSNTLFSPRGIAAKVQMFNPMNYAATEPLVRQQYIKAAARQAGAWWAMAGLSTLAGATVSRDPNSADFGKIKIGNTRIDPPGGLQQFLVLGNRMLPESMGGGGITSTTTDRFKPFGSGFKPNTRMSTLGQFGINRLHPTLKLAYDFLDANPNKPFHVGDQMISHIAPLFAGDLMDVARDNPGLLPIVLPLAGAGMGTQSYEKGSFGKPTFLPEDMDINIGAK